MGMRNFFRSGGRIAWGLVASIFLLMFASTALFARTALVRHERDVSRMVFNDNVELLDELHRRAGVETDRSRPGATKAFVSAQPPRRSVSPPNKWRDRLDIRLILRSHGTGPRVIAR